MRRPRICASKAALAAALFYLTTIALVLQIELIAVLGRYSMAPRTLRSSRQPDADKQDTVQASTPFSSLELH